MAGKDDNENNQPNDETNEPDGEEKAAEQVAEEVAEKVEETKEEVEKAIKEGDPEKAQSEIERLEQWLATRFKDLTNDLASKLDNALTAMDKKIEKALKQSKTPPKPSEPEKSKSPNPEPEKNEKADGQKEKSEAGEPAAAERPQRKIKLL